MIKATVTNAAIIFGILAAINFGWGIPKSSILNIATGFALWIMGAICIYVSLDEDAAVSEGLR